MHPIYYDTETTGVRPAKDRVIELAAYDPIRDRTFCTLIQPQCPIPAECTAISNITDEMVQNAPTFDQVIPSFLEFCAGPVILIAHNNDAFDRLFLENEFARYQQTLPTHWRFFDTLKWARKYRTDLPRHSLQTLREVFGIAANQAHRALDDTVVLHQVCQQMIGDLSWPQIMELMEQPTEIRRMPFGKFRGKPLGEVPKDYVIWLKGSGALDKAENQALKEQFAQMGYL